MSTGGSSSCDEFRTSTSQVFRAVKGAYANLEALTITSNRQAKLVRDVAAVIRATSFLVGLKVAARRHSFLFKNVRHTFRNLVGMQHLLSLLLIYKYPKANQKVVDFNCYHNETVTSKLS
eukprot:1963633-Pleurochrysis_carterae.AAC.4